LKRRPAFAAAQEGDMKIHRAIATAIVFALPLLTSQAQAAEIKVMASTALKTVLEELGPQFEKATGNRLVLTFAPAAVLKGQIEQGAAFDVTVLTVAATEDLAKQGKIAAETRANVARVGLGVAVLKGAPKPDVSTTEAFKHALLNAKSIAFNGVGASRAATEAAFVKLGIADELKPKIKLVQITASEAVTKGEAEVGLGPISEILAASSVELAGAFPTDVQWYLVLSAGVATDTKNAVGGEALIKFLTAPSAAPVLKAKGMEPG
jgi:molybdate transport system substrate-binding protein